MVWKIAYLVLVAAMLAFNVTVAVVGGWFSHFFGGVACGILWTYVTMLAGEWYADSRWTAQYKKDKKELL